MRKVLLFTESTVDLSVELLKQYDIKTIPLCINFNDKSYLDGIDITPSELYHKVAKMKVLPKTAARSIGDYLAFYQEQIKQGFDIVHISLGSGLSSTYQNAFLARSELQELSQHVFLIDSKNLSTGTALLLLKAAGLRDQGMNAPSITEAILKMVPLVRSQFVVESLEYLHMGGRCSTTKKFIGSMFSIKPMIVVKDGIMDVGKTIFGSMRKSINEMLKLFFQDFDQIDPEFVFITHAETDRCAHFIRRKLTAFPQIKEINNIYETRAGCVIGSHCGPGTIGILYLKKADN